MDPLNKTASPVSEKSADESPGYVESTVQFIAQKIQRIVREILIWLGWIEPFVQEEVKPVEPPSKTPDIPQIKGREPQEAVPPPSDFVASQNPVESGAKEKPKEMQEKKVKKKQRKEEEYLLRALQNGTMAPAFVLKQFEKRIPEKRRNKIYENLGKKQPLARMDQWLNAFWRSSDVISEQERSLGKAMIDSNPYLIEPVLRKHFESAMRSL